MYVIEELKLNKFQYVRIPTKKEYFARIGMVNLNPNSYTDENAAMTEKTKTETFAEMEALAEKAREINENAKKPVNKED